VQVLLVRNEGQNQLAVPCLLERCDGFREMNGYFRNEKTSRKLVIKTRIQLASATLALGRSL